MTNHHHHEPLQAMCPIDWDKVPQGNIKEFLGDVFSECQTVIESIPAPQAPTTASGRARSKTESAVPTPGHQHAFSRQTASAIAQAQDLRKEWKEIKVNARENPLGIIVHKLAAKDGKGAWFARRSVHEGLTFDDWKLGLEREFDETMKIQGSPGSGNIRGIGADKRVEELVVEDAGHLQVFQLSAQFPGPTSPRDFVTLLLTSESSLKLGGNSRPLRQFMIVSKPCNHLECPPRQGIIRGYYESVELIREVPVETSVDKRSMSSADLSVNGSKRRSVTPGHEGHETPNPNDDVPTAIEWLMVTRSDPGGSVPRFMIEKGTPPGIVGDAGKFLKWVTAKAAQGFSSTAEDDAAHVDAQNTEGNEETKSDVPPLPAVNILPGETGPNFDEDETVPSSNGLYGIISSAFGVATYATSGLLGKIGAYGSDQESSSDTPAVREREDDEQDGHDTVSDTSSIRSFASALEKSITAERPPESTSESHSEENKSSTATPHEKELRKLQERRRKLEEKISKMEDRRNTQLQSEKEKDAAAIAKKREKHEREIAKQEEKYRREMQKLEAKREHEQRKAEERRRKAAERDEKAKMALEIEKLRADRDLALKQNQLLENQVGELQAQNTMLVRKLGKMGLMGDTDSASSSIKGVARSDSGNRLSTTSS